MTDNHPIIPPPELRRQWLTEGHHQDYCSATEHAITQAARWGADQELEACCEWLQDPDLNVDTYKLRAARRPKPPSLKEQALAVLDDVRAIDATHYNILRNALEALPD